MQPGYPDKERIGSEIHSDRYESIFIGNLLPIMTENEIDELLGTGSGQSPGVLAVVEPIISSLKVSLVPEPSSHILTKATTRFILNM